MITMEERFKVNINDVYTNYLVLERLPQKLNEYHTRYRCKCICGSERIVREDHLLNGTAKSCGCYRDEQNRIRRRKTEGEASFNLLFGSYRLRAKRRKQEFCITIDEFRELTSKPCFYCGVNPHIFIKTNGRGKTFGNYIYNGLDRINSSKGYTLDNVVTCCKICNIAKNDLTQEEFYIWLDRITSFRKEKQSC